MGDLRKYTTVNDVRNSTEKMMSFASCLPESVVKHRDVEIKKELKNDFAWDETSCLI